jgi:hypothetical protein
MCPFFLAHMLSGLLLGVAIVIGLMYFNKLQRLDTYNVLVLVLLASTAVGIHGISHMELKKKYGYTMLL